VFPEYVVAANSRRAVPKAMVGPVASSRGDVPLGIRHAVPSRGDNREGPRKAVCGQNISGWAIFLDLEFTGAQGADCRRCEQVLRRRLSPDGKGNGARGPA
jgi:hypothetical protein